MVIIRNLNLRNLVSSSYNHCMNPVAATFGGVVIRIAQSVFIEVNKQSKLRENNEFYISRCNYNKINLNHLFYIPLLISLPAVIKVVRHVLINMKKCHGKKINLSINYRNNIYSEVASSRVHNIGMVAFMTGSIFLASQCENSVKSSMALVKLGAFAGAMTYASKANQLTNSPAFFVTTSNLLANIAAVSTSIFAVQNVETRSVDYVIASYGLVGSVLSGLLFSRTVKKICEFRMRKIEFDKVKNYISGDIKSLSVFTFNINHNNSDKSGFDQIFNESLSIKDQKIDYSYNRVLRSVAGSLARIDYIRNNIEIINLSKEEVVSLVRSINNLKEYYIDIDNGFLISCENNIEKFNIAMLRTKFLSFIQVTEALSEGIEKNSPHRRLLIEAVDALKELLIEKKLYMNSRQKSGRK